MRKMVEKHVRWNMKAKLIVSILAILLVPSVLIGYFSIKSAGSEVQSQMLNAATENVNLLQNIIHDAIQPRMDDVDYFSKRISAQTEKNRPKSSRCSACTQTCITMSGMFTLGQHPGK